MFNFFTCYIDWCNTFCLLLFFAFCYNNILYIKNNIQLLQHVLVNIFQLTGFICNFEIHLPESEELSWFAMRCRSRLKVKLARPSTESKCIARNQLPKDQIRARFLSAISATGYIMNIIAITIHTQSFPDSCLDTNNMFACHTHTHTAKKVLHVLMV